MKSNRTLAKKVKITKTGKLTRSHQLRSGHYRRHKSKQALRRHHRSAKVSQTIKRSFLRLLGKA